MSKDGSNLGVTWEDRAYNEKRSVLGGYGVSDCGLLGENRTCLLGSPAEWEKGVTEVKQGNKAGEKVGERDCVEDIGDQPQVKLLCCASSSLIIENPRD